MYKISTGKYRFWFTGKSIFIRVNNQNMVIIGKDGSDLAPGQYAHITDLAYRRRIMKQEDLSTLIGMYRLVYTQRSLK